MNNSESKIIKNFHFKSDYYLPNAEFVYSVVEIEPTNNRLFDKRCSYEFNITTKLLKISSHLEYSINDIEILYVINIFKIRKRKIEKIISDIIVKKPPIGGFFTIICSVRNSNYAK